MCQRRAVTSIALALLLGIVAFPVALVFGPVYFPSSLFLPACLGGLLGLSVAPRGQRTRLVRVIGHGVLMVAAVLGVMTLTSNMLTSLNVLLASLIWIGWLLLPILA